MIKKIFAYQRLLFNSLSMNSMKNQSPLKPLGVMFVIFIMFYMNGYIFGLNGPFLDTLLFILLPVITGWQINSIFHYKEKLFELVPFNRSFIVVNSFIFSIVLILSIYIMSVVFGYLLLAIIIGISYLFFPENIDFNPPIGLVNQVIDTTKASMLMFIIMLTILFIGTAIVFIKNKRTRVMCYSLSGIMGYGLLFLLKVNMSISPNTGKIEFMESFSLMSQANTILAIVAVIGMVLCVGSVIFANKMYR